MSDSNQALPFNRPAILGRELEYIRQSIDAMHTSGDGGFTRRCRELLRETLGVPEVLLTPSCTDALELAAILLEIGPDDEVIMPSFNFVSAANAFVMRGARPVFADIRRDTLNLDETLVEERITSRTKAIVVVHYAGVACEIERVLEIAARHGVPVVEDNAHSLFGRFRGRHLGTFGVMATQSFHETKNIACGEGGALLINDESLIERAEIVRDKGTNRQQFFRGQVDKYSWVDLGSSFVLSDILAAFLYAQLECRETIQERRREIWERYDTAFRGRLESRGVALPTVPAHCEQAYHIYYLVLPSLAARQRVIGELARRGVSAVFHYTPLHLARMGRSYGYDEAACPVSVWASERVLRLPFYYDLDDASQDRVIDGLLDILEA
jgi:dTDP-4-amino-4,6-dideoxygalactose transaminase